jgi:hypothetical protein
MGMLLEKQDIRQEIADCYAQNCDTDLIDLQNRLNDLDQEIADFQVYVMNLYQRQGRALSELFEFLGEDLLGELVAMAPA